MLMKRWIKISAKVKIRSVILMQLLSTADSDDLLTLTKASDIKRWLESSFLLCAAFPPWGLFQLFLELLVDTIEVFLLLLRVHEEDIRQLRVVLFELLL